MKTTILLAGWLAMSPLASEAAEAEEKKTDDRFVVVMTGDDSSAEAVFERYPELSGSWEELAKFNLLRSGHVIEIPRAMLAADGVLAKVASAYGDAEVKRSFDARFIPVVPNLLLREGDEIRTWRGAGLRILFDDGNYIFVNGGTKLRIVSLETAEASAASRIQVTLKEGRIWSQIKKRRNGRFEIRTRTANTIIRGTDFRLKVEPGDVTRLEVLDGTVEMEAGGNPVSVSAQQGALASRDAAPITSDLPAPPVSLDAPQRQEVIRRERFDQLFQWSAVRGAAAYHLVIARDDEFFDIVADRRVAAETALRVASLEPGTYFWRVSTIGADGFEGAFSESRYFVFVERRP